MSAPSSKPQPARAEDTAGAAPKAATKPDTKPDPRRGGRPEGVEERGGPRGPEPTRYGDWEKGGRCSDF